MEEWEKEQHELAEKIWNIPFASQNLHKLTKKELLILINAICTDRAFQNEDLYELDIKDTLFEEKCWLIECLDQNFFKKENNNG